MENRDGESFVFAVEGTRNIRRKGDAGIELRRKRKRMNRSKTRENGGRIEE